MGKVNLDELQIKEFSALSIQNSNSQYNQLYTLTTPYILVMEMIEERNDTLDTVFLSPDQFATESYLYSEVGVLNNRGLHRHNYFELMVVLQGDVIQKIESQQYIYHAGQCCLLNPNVKHVEAPQGNCELLFVGLTLEYLKSVVETDLYFSGDRDKGLRKNPVYKMLNLVDTGKKSSKQYIDFFPLVESDTFISDLEPLLAEMIMESRDKKPAYLLFIQGYISRLLQFISDPSKYLVRVVDLENNNTEQIFSQIQIELEQHNGLISRSELSKKLNYSDHYLNKIVKEQTGMSLKSFANVFLLKRAAHLLLQTDARVDDIAAQLGLSNTTYFHKIFKETYGMTPGEYRKSQHLAKSILKDGFSLTGE